MICDSCGKTSDKTETITTATLAGVVMCLNCIREMDSKKRFYEILKTEKHLRSHWPLDLQFAVEQYEKLHVKYISTDIMLDWLEDRLEEGGTPEEIHEEYRQKFHNVIY